MHKSSKVLKTALLFGAMLPAMSISHNIFADATESEVKAPASTNVTVHKLMYPNSSAKPAISNNGETQSLPSNTQNYDKSKYGDVEFTAYDISNIVSDPNNVSDTEINSIVKEVKSAQDTDKFHQGDISKSKYISGASEKKTVAVDDKGNATFSNLAAYQNNKYHIWLIVETKHAKGLVAGIADPMVLVNPMTNSKGTDFLSNIQIYPKNATQPLKMTLTKLHDDGTNDGKTASLAGAKFQLYQGKPGTGKALGNEVTADKDGISIFNNLTMGDYYIVEVPSSVAKYSNDTNPTYLVNNDARNDKNNKLTFSVGANGVDPDSLKISLLNYKVPDGKKELDDTNNGESGQKKKFKATVNVPNDILGGKKGINDNGKIIESDPYSVFSWTDNPQSGLKYIPKESGLSIEGSDGTKLQEGKDYTLTNTKEGGFKIDWINSSTHKVSDVVGKLAGQKLIIRYGMEITDTAAIDTELKNSFDFAWDNTTDASQTHHTKGNVPVYTYGAKFIKESSGFFGSGIAKQPLDGAEFVIKNSQGKYFNGYADKNADGIKDVVWVDKLSDVKDGILTSGKDGKFEITRLSAGDYFYTEIKAPDGYQKLTHDYKFTVTKNTYTDSNNLIHIEDDQKGQVPLTGDHKLIMIGGALVVVAIGGSGVYYIRKNHIKA
ncbi:peptidase [Pediococcus pentosaceus]|uniref:pilin N-terminal domain-containing protein n=1 Tax=Pediococcus pentosaceus TaxID=1255 RepID=UPI00223B8269|nr:SpaA isopeptide-forming pilin-related protein [Pediococcus pentosaceus]MCT1178698.1 peptidase [Pediococcus pentosaceus]